MKRQDISELHTKTLEELKKQLIDLRASIERTKMSFAQKKEINTAQKNSNRRDIARVLTEISIRGGGEYGKKNV